MSLLDKNVKACSTNDFLKSGFENLVKGEKKVALSTVTGTKE